MQGRRQSDLTRKRVILRPRQKGAAAIEFALVAWPVILIIGAICEVGIFLLMQSELQFAVDEATRLVRVNKAPASAAAFKTQICSRVAMINDCSSKIRINVKNADSFATLKTSMPQPQEVGEISAGGGYADIYEPGSADRSGFVIATYDWNFLFPFMQAFGNVPGYSKVRRVYGLAVFRNER